MAALQVVCQIFKPGGYTNQSGTPNYLMDLGPALVGVTWTDSQIGGIQSATFKLKQQYETILDIVAGNWIVFGCYGGTTPVTYGPTNSTIQVLNACDDLGHPYYEAGDSLVISDGVQSEIFKCISASYEGDQLLPNPNFSLPTGWSNYGGGAPFIYNTQDTTPPPGGSNDCLIRLDPESSIPNNTEVYQAIASQTFSVTGAQTYQIGGSLWWAANKNLPAGVSGTIDIVARFFLQEGGYQDIVGNSTAAPTVGYNAAFTTATAPPGAISVLLYIIAAVSNNSGSTFNTGNYLYMDARFSELILERLDGNTLAIIQLGAAVSENSVGFLNVMAQGARVCRLLFQGILTGRTRSTEWNLNFSIDAMGMMWRYQKVISSFTINQQDTGGALYDILLSLTGQVPEVIVNPANFVPTTSIYYSGTSKNQNIASLIQSILQTECGSSVPSAPSESSYWSVWVDELRQVHHAQVPTLNFSAPTFTVDLVKDNLYGDVLGPMQTTDMDITRLVNVVLAQGGTQADGTQLQLVLTHQQSYQTWGYYEGVFVNTNITDQNTLVAWAAGQLGVTAWPQNSSRLNLLIASIRFGCRDLLQITGFTDGSTLVTNPTTIRYDIPSFELASVTAMITLTQEQPNFQSVTQEIANQLSVRALQNASYTNVGSTYVVSGCNLYSSGLTWGCTAGVIVYDGVAYEVPATVGNLTNGQTIYLGFNTTNLTVGPMPMFTGTSNLPGQNWFELQDMGNGYLEPIQQSSFSGIFLGRITALNNECFIETSQQAFGGISGSRIVFQGLSTNTNGQLILPVDALARFSTQQYQQPTYGINSVVTFTTFFQLQANVGFGIYMHCSNTTQLPSCYFATWDTDGHIRIYKIILGTVYGLGTSKKSYPIDTNFHDISIVCKQTQSDFSTITCVFDGNVAVSGTDSSNYGGQGVFQGGYAAVGARTSGSYPSILIDPVNTYIDISSNASSGNLSGIGTIVPIQLPTWELEVASPTFGSPPLSALRELTVYLNGYPLTMSDGSVIAAPSGYNDTIFTDNLGANGTWYYSIAMNVNTFQIIYYLSQTIQPQSSLAQFVADGYVGLAINQSLTVIPGYNQIVTGNDPYNERWTS